MNLEFSVIVVTYNRNDDLKECLDGFKSQTCDSFELFVVDRGSNPSARGVVEAINDNRFSYIQSSQEIHFCDVVNEVMKKIKGKYFCIFGDDDVINYKALDLVKLSFEKNLDSDIVALGSVSLMVGKKDEIMLPSHFSTSRDFSYFQKDVLVYKFSGKEWLRWILYSQYIGQEKISDFPTYIHPSVLFLRKGVNYDRVVNIQGGIAVKPSFDAGYLGLAFYTNVIYLNAPLVVIKFGINNVSIADRRFWLKEIQDVKYLPKIAQLENRGADSLIRVLIKNSIVDNYDITVRPELYKKILKSIERDPLWDSLTIKDYLRLLPPYLKTSRFKVDILLRFFVSVIKGAIVHIFKKEKLILNKEKKLNLLKANQVIKAMDLLFEEQIYLIKSFLQHNK